MFKNGFEARFSSGCTVLASTGRGLALGVAVGAACGAATVGVYAAVATGDALLKAESLGDPSGWLLIGAIAAAIGGIVGGAFGTVLGAVIGVAAIMALAPDLIPQRARTAGLVGAVMFVALWTLLNVGFGLIALLFTPAFAWASGRHGQYLERRATASARRDHSVGVPPHGTAVAR